jgi:FixJ family two-component response regulator
MAMEPIEAQSSDLSGLSVLVVEDSWQVAAGLTMLLQSWGAEVIGPVATISDAERMASERRPNVAIVDINLRGGERSHGLIDRLHQQGVGVVVMTGHADVSLPLTTGITILQKPMREELLLESLRRARAHQGRKD